MKIYSVNDPEFKAYGRVVTGLDDTVAAIVKVLATTDQPAEGTGYVPVEPKLQEMPEMKVVSDHLFGGMPVELGWCNGYNRQLNCLEYHRDSEFNLGVEDFILLLGKLEDVDDFMLDTATVKAFLVPAGTMVEVYATTLHYAPCSVEAGKGFHVLVALPMGTNFQRPAFENRSKEDGYLTAQNKWLLAHPESSEAKGGALVGLKGVNINLDAQ